MTKGRVLTAVILYIGVLIPLGTFGSINSTETKTSEVKTLMDELFFHLTALKKFMISDEKFKDPNNDLEISTHLQKLEKASDKMDHVALFKQDNFKFSQQVLKKQFSEASLIFRLGNKSYARWVINATISVCTSCHSQLPSKSRSLKEFENFKIYTSAFDRAEFLFATRRFDEASNIYDELITNFPKSTDRVDHVEISLERQVAYYSRIKRNADEALTKFSMYGNNKKLPLFLQQNQTAWISQFKDWKRQGPIDPRTISESEIIKLAEKKLQSDSSSIEASNPKLVSYLWISGILYEYLLTHPRTKITPQILYWLSICDRALSNTFFYSLANLYLRECITGYPADPFAKKCLKEYNEEMLSGYTGSSGTHLPPEVQKDLEALKKWIDSKGDAKLPLN